jgi:hypothetical protein
VYASVGDWSILFGGKTPFAEKLCPKNDLSPLGHRGGTGYTLCNRDCIEEKRRFRYEQEYENTLLPGELHSTILA